MSKWRSRGFVQDSEDEDEDSGKSQNTNNDRLAFGRAATAPIDVPNVREAKDSIEEAVQDDNDVARKSATRNESRVELRNNESDTEDELAHGWPTQKLPSHDVNTDQGHGNGFISIDDILPPQSSPLSSLPDVDDLLQADVSHPPGPTVTRRSPQILVSSPPISTERAPVVNVEEQLDQSGGERLVEPERRNEWEAPQRNFRQRKPVQLNPYQILDGQYMQEMRSRGMRATRVINPASQLGSRQDDQDSDSQSLDGGSTQSVFASPVRHRSRSRSPVRPRSSPLPNSRSEGQAEEVRSSQQEPDVDDDGLPTLDSLLQHRKRKDKVYMGAKRRKLQHLPKALIRSQPHGIISGAAPDDADGPELGFSGVHEPSSPELSPHESQELPRPIAHNGFRFPPGLLSPQKPPTPATSSSANGIRHRRARTAGDLSSPAPEPTLTSQRRKQAMVISEDSESSDEGSVASALDGGPKQHSGQLKDIQRRIKGVLPASWLKLDVKAQEKKPVQRPEHRHQPEVRDDGQQPGVARRVLKISGSTRSFRGILGISSDEESEPETSKAKTVAPIAPRLQTTLTQDTRLSSLFPDDDPGDIMEDNAIDFMFPTASRPNRHNNATGRKRQKRITDAFGQSAKRTKVVGGASKTAHSRNAPRTPRFRAPKLSILDATTSSPEYSTKLPPFLKLARRQAKKQRGNARERPGHKNIRLQTREDTHDAQSVLGDWHAGKIRRKAIEASNASKKRQPLTPRDANAVQSASPFDSTINKLSRKVLHLPANLRLDVPTSVIQRQRVLGAPKRHRPQVGPQIQDGQLEAEETALPFMQDRLHFHQAVDQENQEYRTSRKTALKAAPRTLAELEAHIARRPAYQENANVSNEQTNEPPTSRAPRKRRLRKLKPRQVDIETSEYRQSEAFVLPTRQRSHSFSSVGFEATSGEVLRGLNPWGMPYTIDFDVLPLPIGTFFHASTFLGSGAFKASLDFRGRDLDVVGESRAVQIAGRQCQWGVWNEELAIAVKRAFNEINRSVTSLLDKSDDSSNQPLGQIDITACIETVENLLDVNARWLCFSDPVDRTAFGHACVDDVREIQHLLRRFSDSQFGQDSGMLRLLTRVTALSTQLLVVLRQHGGSNDFLRSCEDLVRSCSEGLANFIAGDYAQGLFIIYDQLRRHSVHDSGIKDDQATVEAFVVLHHGLQVIGIPGLRAWYLINQKLLEGVNTTTQLGALEHKWMTLVSLLPLFELSIDGIYQPGLRFEETFDNWDAVKGLLSRTFDLYQSTAQVPNTTINDYVRVLLFRCHHLMQSWGWRRCETIVSLIFDFFAKREYMSLVREDNFGSPRFLEQLATQPSLQTVKDEKAFHILLKLIGLGLQGLRRIYTEKQIRSIVWRWLPNHSRVYDKDKDLRKEDLDALRNQHDLLATLYWVSPPSCRPRLQLIQNLVDHSASHLEACRIGIKTWSNLAAFQLTLDEPVIATESFASWLKDILEQQMAQYKSARPELEAQHEASKRNGNVAISTDRLETMISRNQNGIIAALTDAVAGLRGALKTAKEVSNAWTLLRLSSAQAVFTLFDAKSKKTISVIQGMLLVFDVFVDLMDRVEPVAESQTASEESQDYGDWPDEDEVGSVKKPADEALEWTIEQAHHLLSTIFGSDRQPDDQLLTSMVDHWARLSITAVRRKLYTFDTFLDDYGKYSWSQLRDTSQRRKYSSYYLCNLLERDPNVFERHRELFLSTWLCSMVERDAQLKFQHSLTSRLLNACPDEPLLHNLPFMKMSDTHKYDISTTELRERRLPLLSSVLSNMRDHCQRATERDLALAQSLAAEYRTVVQRTMAQMRANYEDLGQHGDAVTGAYVAFVQQMIEFLTQYATDFCTVDKYFTDSATFPLPAHDPLYLVGRLKGFDAKLNDPRIAKQLIIFMQNVIERAAVDKEQGYLISHLSSALGGSFNQEAVNHTSLKSVFLNVLFPAYLEAAMDESPASILAEPLLQVCTAVLKDMLYKFSATNAVGTQAVTHLMTSILFAIVQALLPLESQQDRLRQASTMSMLGALLNAAASCIPGLDYIRRRVGIGAHAGEAIRYIATFSLYAAKVILNHADSFPPTNVPTWDQAETRTVELRRFCTQQLQQDLQTKWRTTDRGFMVKRGTTWKEVPDRIGMLEEERAVLVRRIEEFHTALHRAKSF